MLRNSIGVVYEHALVALDAIVVVVGADSVLYIHSTIMFIICCSRSHFRALDGRELIVNLRLSEVHSIYEYTFVGSLISLIHLDRKLFGLLLSIQNVFRTNCSLVSNPFDYFFPYWPKHSCLETDGEVFLQGLQQIYFLHPNVIMNLLHSYYREIYKNSSRICMFLYDFV